MHKTPYSGFMGIFDQAARSQRRNLRGSKKALDNGNPHLVLDKLPGVNPTKATRLIVDLINGGGAAVLLERWAEIPNIGNGAVATALIQKGHLSQFLDRISDFNSLDVRTADLLIKKKASEAVITNLDKFPERTHDIIFRTLLKKDAELAKRNIGSFSKLSSETAKILIKKKRKSKDSASVSGIEVFENNIHRFPKLDFDVAKLLARKKRADIIVNNLDKFPRDRKTKKLSPKLAKLLIRHNQAAGVIANLKEFPVFKFGIAKRLIKAKQAEGVFENSERFKKLGYRAAKLAINKDQPDAVINHFDKFKGRAERKTVKHLLRKDHHEKVINNLDKFSPEHHDEIFRSTVKKNFELAKNNIGLFKDLSAKTAKEVIKNDPDLFINNADRFSQLDIKTAELLIDKGKADWTLDNFNRFGRPDFRIAQQVLKRGELLPILKNFRKFDVGDQDRILDHTIKNGLKEDTIKAAKSGLVPGLEFVRNEDGSEYLRVAGSSRTPRLIKEAPPAPAPEPAAAELDPTIDPLEPVTTVAKPEHEPEPIAPEAESVGKRPGANTPPPRPPIDREPFARPAEAPFARPAEAPFARPIGDPSPWGAEIDADTNGWGTPRDADSSRTDRDREEERESGLPVNRPSRRPSLDKPVPRPGIDKPYDHSNDDLGPEPPVPPPPSRDRGHDGR